MSETELGVGAVIVLVMTVLAFLIGKQSGAQPPAPVVPKPSKEQLDAEARAKEFADKALAAKEEAQKLAGVERDNAMAKYQQVLNEGAAELVDDTDALNSYLKQVGEDIRGR